MSAGNYSFTVTDANGCTSTTTGSVSEPTTLQASSSAGSIDCNGGTTTVTVSATGGTAPYSYIWSNGSSTSNILTVTAPGVYCMSVVDANGCVASACYTVQGSTLPTDTICGVVFNDLNGNGVQDAGEPGIAGAYIYVGNYPAYTDSFGH